MRFKVQTKACATTNAMMISVKAQTNCQPEWFTRYRPGARPCWKALCHVDKASGAKIRPAVVNATINRWGRGFFRSRSGTRITALFKTCQHHHLLASDHAAFGFCHRRGVHNWHSISRGITPPTCWGARAFTILEPAKHANRTSRGVE